MLKKLLTGLKSRIEARGERYVRSNWGELHALPFFHSIYYGADVHDCPEWKSPDSKFHSDAPVAIVVTRGGKVSGVVGFEIIGKTILIRQLQGAPKANFHDGTRVEEYTLFCAEQIAKTLNMKFLRIVTPETAIAYREAAEPQNRPSDVAKHHMRKIYGFPEKVGYAVSWFWRIRQPTFYRQMS
jgi:hypothetical protein